MFTHEIIMLNALTTKYIYKKERNQCHNYSAPLLTIHVISVFVLTRKRSCLYKNLSVLTGSSVTKTDPARHDFFFSGGGWGGGGEHFYEIRNATEACKPYLKVLCKKGTSGDFRLFVSV